MNLNLVQHVGCLCGSVRKDSFDFSDAKANVNMQSNKVTLDDTVSVTIRHFSGLSMLLSKTSVSKSVCSSGFSPLNCSEEHKWELFGLLGAQNEIQLPKWVCVAVNVVIQ